MGVEVVPAAAVISNCQDDLQERSRLALTVFTIVLFSPRRREEARKTTLNTSKEPVGRHTRHDFGCRNRDSYSKKRRNALTARVGSQVCGTPNTKSGRWHSLLLSSAAAGLAEPLKAPQFLSERAVSKIRTDAVDEHRPHFVWFVSRGVENVACY